MANQGDAWVEILRKFDRVWDDGNGQYVTPNDINTSASKYEPDRKNNWVRLTPMFFSGGNTTIGGTKQEIPGQVVLQVFTTYDEGVKRGYELSDRFINGFQNQKLSFGTSLKPSRIIFAVGYATDPLDEGSQWQINAVVPFVWHNSR